MVHFKTIPIDQCSVLIADECAPPNYATTRNRKTCQKALGLGLKLELSARDKANKINYPSEVKLASQRRVQVSGVLGRFPKDSFLE